MRGERGLTLLEMLIVLMVVGLMVGLTYPSIGAGLDSLKLRSEADRAAALLTQGITRVERAQAPLELIIDRSAGRITLRGLRARFSRVQQLEPGLTIRQILPPLPGPGEETSRSVLLAPGEPFPAIGLVIGNTRGQQRLVRIDPLTAMAVVETPPDRVSEEETR
jgi:prepilin-type N-terminal cleavage/methylation domain-containing protein